MTEYLNRTFKLLDKSNPANTPFHAIVIAEDDKTVTYVEHGKQSVGVPREHFPDLVVEETEHEKPYLPLKVVKAEQKKAEAVRPVKK